MNTTNWAAVRAMLAADPPTPEQWRALATQAPAGPAPVPQAMTKRELMAAARLSLPTVNRMLRRGTLPFAKIGRSVRIPCDAVQTLLAGRVNA